MDTSIRFQSDRLTVVFGEGASRKEAALKDGMMQDLYFWIVYSSCEKISDKWSFIFSEWIAEVRDCARDFIPACGFQFDLFLL